MPRREYQKSLDDLRADVRALADLVVSRLDQSLDALEGGNREAARAVIDGDDEINDRYLDLEADCIDLFALQQPVASDLRFVAASFKICTDLERIGDLVANLGQYALAADGTIAAVDLGTIGREAHAMVTDAITAYDTEDVAACRQIAARDDEIDALCQRASERVVRDLIERQATADGTPWDVERALDDVSRVLLTIRDLERIADHAVNVTARTLFLVESDPELIY
ncbi:phosphate signaling complex protein PhoU [Halococcoides cellulosivorans]|uniref:Phosphate-specific transport system accessory protein PhoU n=1 Tax=Halococcoides cellulosivorans TaxID=1679096 RepID=A0A2R4X171_9EURY|nr:phosphate signaling complex protein PhoU [Halococcoides cellulosivorans]AWB27535.1 phosphate transport system regulatory protein PhoU [Halococcoides cellulosivorans]